MAFLVAATGAYVFSRFTDQAFADTLGLRTLRYGADPITWVKSHLRGCLPSEGNSQQVFNHCAPAKKIYLVAGNSSDEYGIDFTKLLASIDQELSRGINAMPQGRTQQIARTIYQWVLHNQIISLIKNNIQSVSPFLHDFLFKSSPLMWAVRKCTMYVIPYLHKTVATVYLTKGGNNAGKPRLFASICFSPIVALFIPSIKFRLQDAQVEKRFKEFCLPGKVVLITEEKISPFNMGLLGSLKNGFGSPFWRHPTKVLCGISKLALAGVAAYGALKYYPTFIEAHKTALIAGAIFAVI